ncbi:hypothetical protein BDP27DRAFT_352870 [Rhodocollybia butyracea]|uniref:Uncharacterized protein n=1 Tax=Rhodocollybia butyracea TaxID=206335 RepID=A0A9P5Q0X7_9AGAR|nr:hypothetical protein BDP27DRAFT_352870 [Rhodocollybia butyracea]
MVLLRLYWFRFTSEDTASTIPTSTSSSVPGSSMPIASRSSSNNTPVILGAVLGVLVGLMGIVVAIIILNYRRQIAVRFPRLFASRQDEEHQDGRSVMSSSYDHSNEHTVVTTSTTPMRPPPRLASLPSASRSTITTVASPSTQTTTRPPLPPLNTKQLPPTPVEEGPPSALQKGKSMLFSAVSKRFTPAVGPIPQSTSTADSATSSFFPKPLYDDDRGMVSRQQSLRNTPTRSQTNTPDLPKRLGTGAMERGALFPVKPISRPGESRSDVSTDTPQLNTDVEKTSQTSHPLSPSISPVSLKRKGVPPLTIIPETNRSRNSTHSREEKKHVPPLTIIPESNVSRNSIHSKEESSSPTGKRLSGGKSRREKEKRRRHSKMPMTPQGPRPLPIPTSAYGSPLPSATFSTSPDLASPRSPASRKRRPLPQASRVSVQPGSLNLVSPNMPRDRDISSAQQRPQDLDSPPRDIPSAQPRPQDLSSPPREIPSAQPRLQNLASPPRDIPSAPQNLPSLNSIPLSTPSARSGIHNLAFASSRYPSCRCAIA